MEIERIQLQQHGDSRGMLIALEQDRNVPFAIRRVYYIFATKNGVHRGGHAHRHLHQLAVAVRGSVTFLLDDGSGPVEVVLDDPSQGLMLGRMVWRELYNFSDDCVLMVLADQLYDQSDYITDYADFLRAIHGAMYTEDMAACQSAWF
ncbi:MAG TPA: FdtA/QdtA family cupin domain-containing protein [Rhodanobacter sp.]